jgi:hypothetical protein
MVEHESFGALDILQIQNLVYKYCWHVDHGDFDAMARMFADAEVVLPAGTYFRDPQALAAVFFDYVQLYSDGTPRTRHVTTNLMLEPEGPTRASGNSAVTVFQQTDKLALQPIIGTRNIDRYEKVEGQWRFAYRRIEMDLFGDLSAHMKRTVA